jgi:hypothetical protein
LKSNISIKKHILICLAFTIALNVLALIPESFSVLGSNYVYDLDEQIYGKNYSEWSGQWWILLSNFTIQNVPADDNTGERCNDDQNDPNMFFLFGTFGNEELITRECTIPSSKAILIPVLVTQCSELERASLDTIEKKRDCVYKGSKEGNDALTFSLDGIPLTNLTNYYVEIPINVTLKELNAWGVEPGSAMAYTGGYYVILKPLSLGKHTIDFYADHRGEPQDTGDDFKVNMRYNIDIVNSTNR